MKQTNFSNGHTDTYKGHRDVKAGWAIIFKSNGETYASGHSLDRQRAEKTARSHLTYVACDHFDYAHPYRFMKPTGRYGITSTQRCKNRDHNARRIAEIEKYVRIEIVDC